VKEPFGDINTVNLGDVILDRRYQRVPDIDRIIKMNNGFDSNLVEPITYASLEGHNITLDKQHCTLAAAIGGVIMFPSKRVNTIPNLVNGGVIPQLGRLFVDLQDERTRVSNAVKLKNLLEDGCEPYVSMQNIAHEYGFHVDTEQYVDESFKDYIIISKVYAIQWMFDRIGDNGLNVWRKYCQLVHKISSIKPDYVLNIKDSYVNDVCLKSFMRFFDETYGLQNESIIDPLVLGEDIVNRNRSAKDFAENVDREKKAAKLRERSVAGSRVATKWYNQAGNRKISYKDIGKKYKKLK